MKDNTVIGQTPNAGAPPNYMLLPEIAQMVRKTEKTVRVWMHQGKLPYLKIGRGKKASVLFKREAVERFLDENFSVNGGTSN